jgi:D-amino-acid dehydrogenase
MQQLLADLEQKGVKLVKHEAVTGISNANGKITQVLTANGAYDADHVVLAAGSWSGELAAKLGSRIPLVAGRGYSVTLEGSPYRINHPAVLVEGRVALTPMDGNKIRFGGTMEITSVNTPPRYKRVEGILKAVARYYPAFKVEMPPAEKIWYGYRPCSADGLPYIGRVKKWSNLVMATGHAMLGLSLGAGTGKLVSEIVNEQPTSMNINPFDPCRFD